MYMKPFQARLHSVVWVVYRVKSAFNFHIYFRPWWVGAVIINAPKVALVWGLNRYKFDFLWLSRHDSHECDSADANAASIFFNWTIYEYGLE